MDRAQFMAFWNESVEDDSLRLSASGWSDEAADGGVTIGQHYFDDPDDVYDTVGVMTVVNADGTLRSAVVFFVPSGGNGLDASMERLIAVFAYSALIDATIWHVPQDTRYEILERLDYPSPSESFTGIDNAISEASVRFRLLDGDDKGIVLIARQDNLSGGSATTPPAPNAPAPSPTTSAEYVEFFDGTWEIGVDLEPGTFRTTEPTDGCYWARLSGFSGEFDDIIANEFGSGYQVVTVKPNDVAFESTDCGDWTSDLSAVTETDTSFGEGMFIVGTDLRPGTYRSSEGEGCYWERVSGFGGTFNELIANDFGNSPATVTIRKSDKGFASSDCGTWTLR